MYILKCINKVEKLKLIYKKTQIQIVYLFKKFTKYC